MPMEAKITFKVNGQERTVTSEPRRSLQEVLREDLELTGTKCGCGKGQCGACTVLLDGKCVQSCMVAISTVGAREVTTIEGLEKDGNLHPVQEAFVEAGAIQCGYCTAGMVVRTVGLLNVNPNPSDEQIVGWMNANICRCNGYVKILDAVRLAARKVRR
jgi:aerobic-type carbon monoxide dehydrogenase small subunit (CoxS/CutS family)